MGRLTVAGPWSCGKGRQGGSAGTPPPPYPETVAATAACSGTLGVCLGYDWSVADNNRGKKGVW